MCKRKLKNVTELDCRESPSINRDVLPVIGAMINLRRLCLSGCDKLELDEKSLSNLPGLTDLDLSRTNRPRQQDNRHDLSHLSALTSLRKLNLSLVDVRNVNRLSSLTNLEELYLSGCNRATSLEFVRSLPELVELDVSGCCKLQADDLRHTSQLSRLRNLAIEGVPVLADGLHHVYPDSLEELSMTGSLRHIDRFPKLKKLSAGMAAEVKQLGHVISIEELDLETNRVESTEFEFLKGMAALRKLNLNDSVRSPDRAFPYLKDLTTLDSLTIRSPVFSSDLLSSVRELSIFPLLKEFIVYYRYCPLSPEERVSIQASTKASVQWRTNWD
jgi:Leucine-rich repeat (LRR) protein